MKILLTNDDGYASKGIQALFIQLRKAGHDVVIVAPKNNMSTVSRALSKNTILHKEDVDIYSVVGTPADCIYIALGEKRVDFNPDIVISGINSGFNLSLDIAFSGTCSAAAEAVSWGYKAIAISSEADSDTAINKAALFLIGNLDVFSDISISNAYISINVPDSTDGEVSIGTPSDHRHRGPIDFSDSASILDAPSGSDKDSIKNKHISISSIEAYPMEALRGRKLLEKYRRQLNGCKV